MLTVFLNKLKRVSCNPFQVFIFRSGLWHKNSTDRRTNRDFHFVSENFFGFFYNLFIDVLCKIRQFAFILNIRCKYREFISAHTTEEIIFAKVCCNQICKFFQKFIAFFVTVETVYQAERIKVKNHESAGFFLTCLREALHNSVIKEKARQLVGCADFFLIIRAIFGKCN